MTTRAQTSRRTHAGASAYGVCVMCSLVELARTPTHKRVPMAPMSYRTRRVPHVYDISVTPQQTPNILPMTFLSGSPALAMACMSRLSRLCMGQGAYDIRDTATAVARHPLDADGYGISVLATVVASSPNHTAGTAQENTGTAQGCLALEPRYDSCATGSKGSCLLGTAHQGSFRQTAICFPSMRKSCQSRLHRENFSALVFSMGGSCTWV